MRNAGIVPSSEQVEAVAQRMRLRVVDALLVLLERGGVGRLLGDDLRQAVARRSTRIPAVEVNALRGITVRSSTNWPAGTSSARSSTFVPGSWTSPRT